jgi:hypothetical protein
MPWMSRELPMSRRAALKLASGAVPGWWLVSVPAATVPRRRRNGRRCRHDRAPTGAAAVSATQPRFARPVDRRTGSSIDAVSR